MGASLIWIVVTGLDFDVLLPITDITGRQAYFSLITSNSCDLHSPLHQKSVNVPRYVLQVCVLCVVVKKLHYCFIKI